MHVVSLDAAKAFENMCREGLFNKLKGVSDPAIWRLFNNYYERSKL